MVDKTTGSNPQPNAEQGSDSPQYVTADEFDRRLNAAITARLRPITEKVDGGFSELKALLEKPVAEEPKKATVKQPDPEVEILKTQLKAIQAERVRGRDNSLKAQAGTAFVKKGVNPDGLAPLLALHAGRTIVHSSDDSDDIVVRLGDSVYGLEEGIDQMIKSDPSMKIFLAPKGASGSGDTGYRESVTRSTGATDAAQFSSFLRRSVR